MSVHYNSFLIMHLRKWLTEKGKFGFSPKYKSFFGHKILILSTAGNVDDCENEDEESDSDGGSSDSESCDDDV